MRICDQIVTFQDMRYNLVDDDNSKLPLSTSEILLQTIKQLINIRRKDDTKLLSVDVNDHQLDQHLQVINLALFNCVNSIVPQESALTSAVYYTTLRNTPKQMDFKMDLNLVMDDEVNDPFFKKKCLLFSLQYVSEIKIIVYDLLVAVVRI